MPKRTTAEQAVPEAAAVLGDSVKQMSIATGTNNAATQYFRRTSGFPGSHSADYRLSALQTFTYGVSVSVMIKEHLTLDFGYKRLRNV